MLGRRDPLRGTHFQLPLDEKKYERGLGLGTARGDRESRSRGVCQTQRAGNMSLFVACDDEHTGSEKAEFDINDKPSDSS